MAKIIRVVIDAEYEIDADGNAVLLSGEETVLCIDEMPIRPGTVVVGLGAHFPMHLFLGELGGGMGAPRIVDVISPMELQMQRRMRESVEEISRTLGNRIAEYEIPLELEEVVEAPSWRDRGGHFNRKGRRRPK